MVACLPYLSNCVESTSDSWGSLSMQSAFGHHCRDVEMAYLGSSCSGLVPYWLGLSK
jgi:hypothetical protein